MVCSCAESESRFCFADVTTKLSLVDINAIKTNLEKTFVTPSSAYLAVTAIGSGIAACDVYFVTKHVEAVVKTEVAPLKADVATIISKLEALERKRKW